MINCAFLLLLITFSMKLHEQIFLSGAMLEHDLSLCRIYPIISEKNKICYQ